MNVCTKCVDKYFLANPTTCTIGTINDCLTYTSSTVCSKCNEEKMPSSNGNTCIAGTLTGCRAYSGNLACSTCNIGYTLNGVTCAGQITNCLTFNSATSCRLCANNFEPTADNTRCVLGSLPGCRTYASRGICTNCILGYTLSGSTCLDTIANCRTYSVDGLTCTACKNTFEPDSTNKKCITGDNANCLTYSALNVCSKCADKYYLASATTCTAGNIVDCVVYNSVSVCSKCVDGKMPSSNGVSCVNGIISNCKSYSAFAVCATCHMGYTTASPNTECKSSITNCMIYASETLCKQCVD
jgi:proprotein convertase subtilisin/kexin type 5